MQFGSRPAYHILLVRSIRFVRYDRVCAQLVTSAVVSNQHSEMKTIDTKKKKKRRKCSSEQWSIVVMCTCFSPLAFPFSCVSHTILADSFFRSYSHIFCFDFLVVVIRLLYRFTQCQSGQNRFNHSAGNGLNYHPVIDIDESKTFNERKR